MALPYIDIEEARNNIKAIMSEVYHSGEEAIITRKGNPWVVISPSACLLE